MRSNRNVGSTTSLLAAFDWGYGWGRWSIDVNGDGTKDYCRVVGMPGDYGMWCTLSTSQRVEDLYAGQTIQSDRIDVGYTDGRAWVDFDGDNKLDYCRIVGVQPSTFARCLVWEGNHFGREIDSAPLDWGYPETRKWADVNNDGRADFCRVVGNDHEFIQCTLSAGRDGFGKTISDINK